MRFAPPQQRARRHTDIGRLVPWHIRGFLSLLTGNRAALGFAGSAVCGRCPRSALARGLLGTPKHYRRPRHRAGCCYPPFTGIGAGPRLAAESGGAAPRSLLRGSTVCRTAQFLVRRCREGCLPRAGAPLAKQPVPSLRSACLRSSVTQAAALAARRPASPTQRACCCRWFCFFLHASMKKTEPTTTRPAAKGKVNVNERAMSLLRWAVKYRRKNLSRRPLSRADIAWALRAARRLPPPA